MKTLYLDKMPGFQTLASIESAISREIAVVAIDQPAINIETNGDIIIEDAVYWLRVAGYKVREVA